MDSNEHLGNANYDMDQDAANTIDSPAYSAIRPDGTIQGWGYGTHDPTSPAGHGFDAIVLSPTFAPTYSSYAASMPLPYHSQGLNSMSQTLSGHAASFIADSITSQSQNGTNYGSEGLSPETAWSSESVVSAAVTDRRLSPGNHQDLSMPTSTPAEMGSSRSKRSRRTDEKHGMQEKTSTNGGSGSSGSNTKKKRKGKDQSRTEAMPHTSKSRSTMDTTDKRPSTKTDGKHLPAASTHTTSIASPAESKKTSASRHRGDKSRKGSFADPPDGEPPMATQRERNRMAATRCRAKTKAAIQQLELDERSISDHRHNLATTRDSLRAEVLHYRSLLLQHQDCNCAHIRQYLQKAAELIARTGGQHPIWGRTGEGGEWADYHEPCELDHDIEGIEEEDEDGDYDV